MEEKTQSLNLRIVPLTIRELNDFVELYHRHHKKVQGHRFSLGVMSGEKMVGACSVGRPVARGCDPSSVAEVTRLVSDGTKNVCSSLYAAAARACAAMGFKKIQTYILGSEPGTSLKAAGWKLDGEVLGRQWKHTDGKPRREDQPTCDKQRWAKYLNE